MIHDIIIGIDPDVDKSGVALLNTASRCMETSAYDFPNLIDLLIAKRDEAKEKNLSLIVVVEASWLVQKANYHAHYGRAGDAISRKVGENHEVGKLIIQMCKHHSITAIEMHPLKKMWRGKDGKITAEELQQMCGIFGRTNQEMRDACLIAWCYANFPLGGNFPIMAR